MVVNANNGAEGFGASIPFQPKPVESTDLSTISNHRFGFVVNLRPISTKNIVEMDALYLSSLPPGFGFHPTDAELITYYLKNKVIGNNFENDVIPLVDIYKHEPWDLPAQCNVPTREAKWHFFSYGDKKYPKGTCKNRATRAGYWKSTGKDRIIKHQNRNVGTKKTLVFHEGRPPVGKRTEWIMHEYYVNDREFKFTPEMKDSYVLCRINYRGIWDPVHGFEMNASNSVHAPSNSVHAPSNSVESEEEMNAWIAELIDPNFTGSPICSALNSVDTVGSSAILEPNQEAVNSQPAPEIYEDPDHLFFLEDYINILESENQNTDIFKDFNIDTDIFIDQQDDVFSFMENHEFAQSNLYIDNNNDEETGIEVKQREEEPSSFTETAVARLKLQVNKLEKRSNNEPLSEFFDGAVCLNRVHSMRVNGEIKVQNTEYKSRQSTFVNCFFLCAFITAVVAIVCYFKMRNARLCSLS